MNKQEEYETYSYRIDDNDIIVTLSDNWQDFLTANHGAENTHAENVIGKSLWTFICGVETRHLYQVVLRTVRDSQHQVKLLFRCDAPDARRYLQLIVAPGENSSIEFKSQIIKTESRESVDVLRHDLARSEDAIRMCSMCKHIEVREQIWEETEQAINTMGLFEAERLPHIIHGLCPACFNAMMNEIVKYKPHEGVLPPAGAAADA